ncbi:unnamed protein product [Eruca vesicaria subsp. sativa]|uniref:Uncharacterized protein n=1 Tax=Eruca vesicaria subsp. sativa TaxID=29727 RepID=A0ABC8IST9_ERUVS|nr:unnamed protein product [Eruca vesicaria subsp. sativa]
MGVEMGCPSTLRFLLLLLSRDYSQPHYMTSLGNGDEELGQAQFLLNSLSQFYKKYQMSFMRNP